MKNNNSEFCVVYGNRQQCVDKQMFFQGRNSTVFESVQIVSFRSLGLTVTLLMCNGRKKGINRKYMLKCHLKTIEGSKAKEHVMRGSARVRAALAFSEGQQ